MAKWTIGASSVLLVLVLLIGCAQATPAQSPASPKPATAPASTTAVPSSKPAATPAKTIELKVDIYTSLGSPVVRNAEKFLAPEVERRTGGRLKLKLFPVEALGPAAQAIDRAASGAVDIAYIATSYQPGRFLLLEVLDLAFLSPNLFVPGAVSSRMAREGWYDEPDAVCLWTQGLVRYNFLFTKKRITTVADFKGLKIRGPGGLRDKYVQSLGATTVKTTTPEMYNAAQTGIVEGLAFAAYGLNAYKLMEVVKYQLDVGFVQSVPCYYMNKKLLKSLPEDLQGILLDMGLDAAMSACQMATSDDKFYTVEAAQKYGVETYELSSDELNKMKAAMAQVSQDYVKDLVSKGGDRARKYLDQLKYVLSNYELEFPIKY